MKKAEKQVKGLIFDFDYTLVDSTEAIYDCANTVLKQMGYPPASHAQIRDIIADSLEDAYVKLTGDNDLFKAMEYAKRIRAYQGSLDNFKTKFFDGIQNQLESLKRADIKLGIVSTNDRVNIERFLKQENMLSHFSSIVSATDVNTYKPHPQGMYQCLKSIQLAQKDVVFFGDSLHDAGAAKNAGVDFAGVLTGHATKKCFESFPNIGVYDHAHDAIHDVSKKYHIKIPNKNK